MEINSKKIAKETARMLFSIKAITLNPQKPYRYTSGILSPIYTDNRMVISYPDIRNKIIDFYLKIIRSEVGLRNIDVISGTATAAITQAMIIADRLKRPMVYVEVPKKEDTPAKIRGIINIGDNAIVIEDLISTGGSAVGNTLALRKAGGKVKYCIATTTYKMKKAHLLFTKNKVKLLTLTNINSVLDTAIEDGLLKKEERKMVEEWLVDPPSWGKKMGFE